MEKEIKLQLIAIDFKGSMYLRNDTCPIANAVRRTFGATEISEAVFSVRIDGKDYWHLPFYAQDFRIGKNLADQALAEGLPDKVIKEIILTLQEEEKEQEKVS